MIKLYAILLSLSTLLLISACETEEYFNGELVDSEVVITFPNAGGLEPFSATFTELDDIAVDLAIEGNVNAVMVGIADSSDDVGLVDIANGVGTFTATPTALGIPDAGDALELRFTAPLPGGGTTTRLFDIEITDPITISPPIFIQQNPVSNYVSFSVETAGAPVDGITVMLGTGDELATVATPANGWNAEGDSLAVVGASYEVGDTVLVSVTANSGAKMTSSQTSAIVRTYAFGNESEEIAFDSVGAGYDLVAGGASVAGADTTDIELSADALNQIQILSQNGAEFVETSGLYEGGDRVVIQEAYDTGTPASITGDLEEGDELIYRTERTVDGETEVYYGIIQVTDVDRTNEGNDSLSLRYKFE